MSLWSLSLLDFRERAASVAPTPGGGSVAAVCGALGASLVAMALQISLRGGQNTDSEQMLNSLTHLQLLIGRIGDHADTDVAVFEQYMRAIALPTHTESQVHTRQEAVQAAGILAAEAPLDAARDMLSALEIALQATYSVKKRVLSDVLGGAELLRGGIAASLRTVDINLSQMQDAHRRDSFKKERETLASAVEEIMQEISQ
jgi:formiminotetrahydrofolate cyclodeaminase